jgi:hypothetical protein
VNRASMCRSMVRNAARSGGGACGAAVACSGLRARLWTLVQKMAKARPSSNQAAWTQHHDPKCCDDHRRPASAAPVSGPRRPKTPCAEVDADARNLLGDFTILPLSHRVI